MMMVFLFFGGVMRGMVWTKDQLDALGEWECRLEAQKDGSPRSSYVFVFRGDR